MAMSRIRKENAMKIATTLGLMAMLMAGAALSATAAESSAGRVLDDTAITTKVKAALASDANVSALKVHVKTYNGTVQLNGHVGSVDEKAAAETVASKVEGVKDVKNNLEVGKEGRSAGSALDDTAITAKVKAAFAGSPAVKASQIGVKTRNGVVTLSGFADSSASKMEAERLAQEVKNVTSVENNVEVRK
jgi:hyperosmotically inducible periplasmic protein